MKYTLLSILFVFSVHLGAQTQSLDKIAAKYEGKDGFTSVTVTKSMFDLFAEIDSEGEDKEFLSILKNLNEIRILTKEGDKEMVFYKEVLSSVSLSGYEKLMEVNDSGEKVKFYVIKKDGKIQKFLLLVGSTDESTVIYIDGIIDMKQISKLAGGLKLDKLEKGMEKVNSK